MCRFSPDISVAPEKLIEEPIIANFLGLGPFYLANTLPTLVVTIDPDHCPGVLYQPLVEEQCSARIWCRAALAMLMEAILEMIYNLTEGSAGQKWARAIFPWFATIMIYVLFANLLKLIPGFESIGVLHHARG